MLAATLARLADRDSPRTEAEIQADVRSFILTAPFSLHEEDVRIVALESPVGIKRRIDVEVGSTVIEVKRDLRKGKVREDAVDQLAGYVQTRADETGLRYAGVITDGVEWRCYHLVEGVLSEVSNFELRAGQGQVEDLTVWVEGVLATSQGIPPTGNEIRARLGAQSSSHKLDRATLAMLYAKHRHLPTVKLKRTLWSRLLVSALGTQFNDSDELFVEHTLLVNSAEIVAHAVLGLAVTSIDPKSLLTGAKFDESGVYGVVEEDFFDWIIEVPGGPEFVGTLARRLGRFDWGMVDHDVLKVLYESVIGAETRKKLGEYYTPDWLAEGVVREVVKSPLSERVLDPACGSGTFLFHAVRHYITAAEASGASIPEVINGVTANVIGMDLHPVAVTFARVTYLLAIGRERLTSPDRPSIHVPVYLGDSIQWRQQVDLLTAGNLVVHTDDDRELFSSELRFPDALIENAANFDRLIVELSQKASSRSPGSKPPSLKATFARLGIPTKHQEVIESTFAAMCKLNDEGRDHIWAYYIRNLARPMWLAAAANRVDAIIGNPPWLAYRNMTTEMQQTFRSMSNARGLWHGAEVATQQDLSALFVVRAMQLYLKKGGRFGMVLPNAAVDRPQFTGLRTGSYEGGGELLRIQFARPWDLRRLRPHIFPRGSCVLFGQRTDDVTPLPNVVTAWAGRVPASALPWDEMRALLTMTESVLQAADESDASIYRERFRNGATIFPRVLFLVEEVEAGPLGTVAGRKRVRSLRGTNEKPPWKSVESLTGVVESEFVRPVILSECLLPFRITAAAKAVLPIRGDVFIGDSDAEIEGSAGLSAWWKQADLLWKKLRSSTRLTLAQQLNYMRKLSEQLPSAELRVVYNKSGMHVVAAKVRDKRAVIENGLYWAVPSSGAEADYLCAVLNSSRLTDLVRPLMSYGKDERDVAKSVWKLPIPEFDAEDARHAELATLGAYAEMTASQYSIDPDVYFPTTRRRFRAKLEADAAIKRIDDLVLELLA